MQGIWNLDSGICLTQKKNKTKKNEFKKLSQCGKSLRSKQQYFFSTLHARRRYFLCLSKWRDSQTQRWTNESIFYCKNKNQIEFTSGGQPSAFHLDKTGKTCFIADLAHQAIFSKNIEDKTSELSQLVKDFEGEPFLGPHSLALTDDMSIFLYIKIQRLVVFYWFRTLGWNFDRKP